MLPLPGDLDILKHRVSCPFWTADYAELGTTPIIADLSNHVPVQGILFVPRKHSIIQNVVRACGDPVSVTGREDRGAWYCGVLRVNVGLGFQNCWFTMLILTPQSLALTTPSWILKQTPPSFKLLKITYFGKFRKVSLLPALSSVYHLKRTFAAVGLSSLFLVTGYSAGGCGCGCGQRGRGRVSVHAKCACGHQRTISSVSPLLKHLFEAEFLLFSTVYVRLGGP